MSRADVAPARRAAYEVLRRTFEHDAWADRAFTAAAERHRLDARERGQGQRLAYGAVQRRGTTDRLIAELADRSVARLDPPVLAALRLGMYELLFSEATPAHAAVDQAVELAKGEGGERRRAGASLVNAVLRRAATAGELLADLDDGTPEGAAALHSYPDWLARMWWAELGPEDARSLMAAMNEPAETALRVNTLKADPDALVERLRATGEPIAGGDPGPLWPPEAIVVDGPLSQAVRARIAAGELVPQSRGSQAAVAALDPRPDQRILDLCAAPGIKTTAIAARVRDRGEVVAVDQDPGRASQLEELCERLGVRSVRVVVGDAAEIDLGDGYDRVLVDPPCSDLGTLASRPDARWRKSPELIERVAGLQAKILGRAAATLKPGGKLAYSVCTISRREGPDQVESLDARSTQLRPDRDGTDGFFIATVERA
ncbi:MAG: methyltransferase domain-containing protein [Actinobacteria bacterium]|nr:MAG: methyltransferase domain-containing protein [Actinomycetota bacterium]